LAEPQSRAGHLCHARTRAFSRSVVSCFRTVQALELARASLWIAVSRGERQRTASTSARGCGI
jgi:hypothetical protein